MRGSQRNRSQQTRLTGVASHIIIANLSHTAANADQFSSEAGVQSGFTHLDASAVTGFA